MLVTIFLSIITLTSASCPINPTNPGCPIWLQSNVTEAQFNVNQGQAFEMKPAGQPLIGLSSNTNIYFKSDGNLIA